MRSTTCIGALLLLALGGCGREAERQLTEVRAELAKVRTEFADYRSTKEREIDALKSQLEQKTKELAEAEKTGLDRAAEFAETAKAKLNALEEELATKASEVAAALQRAADLTKARDALQNQLTDVRNALNSQTAKIDSLTAELAKLKKLLGR